MRYLCDNPVCPNHCLVHAMWRLVVDPVTKIAVNIEELRFKDGFQCLVPRAEEVRFDPESPTHLCRVCSAVCSMP